MPPGRALDEFEALYRDVRTIAGRFTALYDEYVAAHPEQHNELARQRFTALGTQAVFELTQHALRNARLSIACDLPRD